MSLSQLLSLWKYTPQIAENIAHWETIPARTARGTALPPDLHPGLADALRAQGIHNLYIHQSQAWEHARAGRHVVIATGTASGKTLGYNLPVLDHLLRHPDARALYLFPTKALAQDQWTVISKQYSVTSGQTSTTASLTTDHSPLTTAIYDGDTPRTHRPALRENARIILSNPDMMHLGILPYHTSWVKFFRNLQFVVIDEMHTYRGVFGSHVANVLRRIKRIAAFYGAAPQFILTSATIANPVELAEKLIEAPVEVVREDGSARGAQHFLIYNPPVIDEDLGIRRGILQESVYLTGDLLTYQVQTLLFGRSRRTVELMLRYLREGSSSSPPPLRPSSAPASTLSEIRSYRSGYLPAHRREIERGLREGTVRAVAATNALELGINIGGMGAVVLAGFPGTISGTWQQAGRAGRGSEESLAVLLTSANPLDQYLARHPEYFFARSPESALINPDNLLILLDHLRCAAFELPFRAGEGFGLVTGETVAEYLDFLAQTGELHPSKDKYFWTAQDYPAQRVSLRTASARRIILQTFVVPHASAEPHARAELQTEEVRTLGEVDGESAPWMVHPGAIYLHEAESYLVDELDLESGYARLHAIETDYYTEPTQETEVTLIELKEETPVPGGIKSHGEVQATTQVTGYQKIRWFTSERLGSEPLEMPPSQLQTTGYWLSLAEETVDALREAGLWSSDPNRYGPTWPRARDAARARDGYRCQSCGLPESGPGSFGRSHDVHHKIPFRQFVSAEEANRLDNLVTLCPPCHRRAETAVRIRSGLSGLGFVLGNLAPLFLMCDPSDIQTHADPQSPLGNGQPTVIMYERIPGGIGLAQRLFEVHGELIGAALELVAACACADGCPSCVGPG
ncbi:MAG: DEAD/DEAH box helicase, partial [Anaerolineales bacterium]|nr:DEAD/DEAH box helicase [Anaerolineales bacterium]